MSQSRFVHYDLQGQRLVSQYEEPQIQLQSLHTPTLTISHLFPLLKFQEGIVLVQLSLPSFMSDNDNGSKSVEIVEIRLQQCTQSLPAHLTARISSRLLQPSTTRSVIGSDTITFS